MDPLLEIIVSQLQRLSPEELRKVEQFVQRIVGQAGGGDEEGCVENTQSAQAFAEFAEELIGLVSAGRPENAPSLSDYAVSREGLYGDRL